MIWGDKMQGKIVLHYLKRISVGIAVTAVFAAALYNNAADDIRLQREIDKSLENSAFTVSEKSSAPVNINTASVHHLQRIDGIGETKARAIAEYRDTHGNFSSVDEIVNVNGIGESTFEKIRDMITV